MSSNFIHLRLHTEYSLIDGIVRVKPLVKKVAEYNMPAVAITDQANLFAAVKFYKAALAVGIKPIIGADLWLLNEQDDRQPFHLIVLCQNEQGYRNLAELVTRGYAEGQQLGIPLLHRAWLEGKTEGLLALSGGRDGDIGHALLARNIALAESHLDAWLELFPQRFYLELQRTGRQHEEAYLQATVQLAERMQVPVVATNDVRFIQADDFEAHEARVCINQGWQVTDAKRPKCYSEQQYLRTPAEMADLFADIPEALANTVEIAKRCNLQLHLDEYFLPNFPLPEGMTVERYLVTQAEQGLQQRLAQLFDSTSPDFQAISQQYSQRLHLELDVINAMGFPGYFLIVADFIQWSKQNGIPVGPGRGSGAGSLVAYALQITDLDPLKYELLFERFLNPERVSMPDFDIDFCMDGRDRVIEYVAHKYGRESVAQIITYGSMAAKAVVRDVGRVLGYPYGFVDKVAKLIPFEIGITLDKALAQEEQLRQRYQDEEDVKELIDLALKLEGIARNAGKHAGGVVIAPSKLTHFTALYYENLGANPVTQFDKDDVEAVGLVKFDFLGLRTLTIIDWAVQIINGRNAQTELDITRIPIDDVSTFSLLKACATTAVFQLESRGMKDLIKRLQPDSFEDIIALVALFRPGPLQSGMVDDFINRKHGRAKIEYPHPALEPILKPTYGVILYQEQVMQIAQVLAGYTLGGADLLRRAMGKKKPEEMAKQRSIFVDGAVNNGVSPETAGYIFDLMEKFAGYGFNKSHSAAYALLSYQTSWLKAHYPAAFMAAVLSSDMDNIDKVVMFIEECRQIGLTISPPRINQSSYKFTVLDERTIVYGLGAIKGLGENAIEAIIASRDTAFTDLFDLCRRIDLRKVNRRSFEALIRAGALDEFGVARSSLLATLPNALQMAEKQASLVASGQGDLFGLLEPSQEVIYVIVPEWQEHERLAGEKETLGLYLTGHPIAQYEAMLSQFISCRLADIRLDKNQSLVVAGLVVDLRIRRTKRGDKMAIITLDDKSARIEIAIFADIYETYQALLEVDKVLIIEGEVALDRFTGNARINTRKILNVATAREQYAKCITLTLEQQRLHTDFWEDFRQQLTPYRNGNCRLKFIYKHPAATAHLQASEEWCLQVKEELLARLSQLLGNEQFSIEYR
jgi:DNA polymerase-3 subunit alpha